MVTPVTRIIRQGLSASDVCLRHLNHVGLMQFDGINVLLDMRLAAGGGSC